VTPAAAVRFGTGPGRWVLAATVLGSAIGFIDATVVNVALPTIGRDFDASVASLQWTINGYLLTLAALILLGGALGDRYGRRRVFLIGVVWFGLASLLCALAPSAGLLIAARVLQGIGGALLTPGSLAIIDASFHPEDRSRAIGAWSALGGVAAAVGPLVGGWLVDVASWRWIFLINLPVVAVVLAISARHVPESRAPVASGPVDVAGSAAAIVALGGLSYALIEGAGRGVGSAAFVVPIAGALGGLAALAAIERRAPAPILPRGIFASGQFVVANVLTFVVYGALGGVFFLLVVDLQTVLGYSPLGAGAASLPITVMMLLLSARAGHFAQRFGPRIPLTVGPLLVAAGMLLMTRIGPGASYVGSVLPAVLVFGLGLAGVVAPITATALAAAKRRHSGVASAINNAVSRTAQLLAVAVLPLAVGLSGADYADPARFSAGFQDAMLITAIVAALGALLAWRAIDDHVLEVARAHPSPATEAPHCCGVEGAPLGVPELVLEGSSPSEHGGASSHRIR